MCHIHILYIYRIQSCNEQLQYREALDIFDLMKTVSLMGDRICFGAAMTSCLYDVNLEKAKEIFDLCDKAYNFGKSTKFDDSELIIFTQIIATCDKCGEWKDLLFYYDQLLLRNRLNQTIGSINHAIRACMKTKNWMKLSLIINTIDVSTDGSKANDNDGETTRTTRTTDSVTYEQISLKIISECITQLQACTCSEDVGAAITKVSEHSEVVLSLL